MSTAAWVIVVILFLGVTLLLVSLLILGKSLPHFARARARKHWRYPKLFIWFFLASYVAQIFLVVIEYPFSFLIFSSINVLFSAIFIVVISVIARRNVLDFNDANIENRSIEADSEQHQFEASELQKLAAVGQVAGGLAHDFNNLLSIVVGNLDEMRESLPAESLQAQMRLDAALSAALGGVEVTRTLLGVARRDQRQIQQYDLNTIIRDILPLIASSAGSAVVVRTQLTADKLLCRLNASGLDNVILNLAINARDAMQNLTGNSILTLRTNRVSIQAGFNDRLLPGWHALVEVSDTGIGMTEAVLMQVFQPFFTTKERNQGTGLGMATVHRYLDDLGGVALVESTEGIGTAVRLYIPLDNTESDSSMGLESQPAQNRALAARPDGAFDLVVAEAARICRVPVGLLSLADEYPRWLAASIGIEQSDVFADAAFFTQTIHNDGEVLVVPDINRDPRFAGKKILVNGPPPRFYASAPLLNADGAAVGALTVVDYAPGTLTHAQTVDLQKLALRAMSVMKDRPKTDKTVHKVTGDIAIDRSGSLFKSADIFNILVVDDEAALCELSATWLTSIGYEVATADGPMEALEYLAKERYCCLFTDIVMPGGMDGIELAKKAVLLQPHLRVLLTSGYAERLLEDNDLHGEVLSKPYRKTDLINALNRL